MFRLKYGLILSVLCLYTQIANATVVFDQGRPHIYLSIDSPHLANLSTPNFITGDALNDLRRCFQVMTGQPLPDAPADGLIPMRLVLIDPAVDAKESRPLGRQGYEIRVSDREIVLAGTTKLGVANAIYRVLDTWGCKWIMPGEDGEIIPQKSHLELAGGDQRHTDYMDQRIDGGQTVESNLWRARNGGGLESWISFQHYFSYFFPHEEYFKDHPDFYAWRAGARRPVQLETANPQVVQLIIEKALTRLRTSPGLDSVPMDWDDNVDYSVSPQSLALDPPGNPRFEGMPSMTDRTVLLANAVADAIAKEFPDKLVGFYAYTHHMLPPVAVKPRPNVGVGVTRAGFSSIRYMPDETDPMSLAYWKVLKDWLAICGHVYTYDYDPVPRTEGLPSPLILQRASAIKEQYALGVKGNYTDKVGANLAASFANYYLEYRIKADPHRDPAAELKQMCDLYFGPAGPAMNDYYLALDEASRTKIPFSSNNWTVLGIVDFFTPEILTRADQSLRAAAGAVQGDAKIARRVHIVRLSFEILRATMTGVWNARNNNYAASVAAFDQAVQVAGNLDKLGPGLIVVNRFKEVLGEASGKLFAEHFPDRLGFARNWLLLGPIPNDHRDSQWLEGEFPKALFPEGVAIGRPVQLADGSKVNWKQYTSPEGQVNFTTAFDGIQRDWTFSTAIAMGVIQVRTPQKAQFRFSTFHPVQVFLNGQQVYDQRYWDSDAPDKRVIPVDLKAGENLVIIRSSQYVQPSHTYRWGFYFRLTDSEGKSLGNLRISTKPADVAKALESYPPG